MAAENRRLFQEAGVVAIDVAGTPGAGKTSLIRAALAALPRFIRTAVLFGEPAMCSHDGLHLLDAEMVHQAVLQLDLKDIDYLFIEHAGGLLHPGSVDIGQTARVIVLSAADSVNALRNDTGALFSADLIVLNKMDLLPASSVGPAMLLAGIRRLNRRLEILEVSCHGLDGIDSWIDWVQCPTSLEPFYRPALANHAFEGGE